MVNYPAPDYYRSYVERDSILENFDCITTNYMTVTKLVRDKNGELMRTNSGWILSYDVAEYKEVRRGLYEETDNLEVRMWRYIHENNIATDYSNVTINNEQMKISKFFQLFKDKF